MPDYYEWEITAVRPDTAADISAKILPTIKAALKEQGLAELLNSGAILVEQKETFLHLDTQAVDILVGFTTKAALDAFRAYVVPKLRFWAKVSTEKKRAGSTKMEPSAAKAQKASKARQVRTGPAKRTSPRKATLPKKKSGKALADKGNRRGRKSS